MKIHEFQAKALLAKYGVDVPKGGAVESKEAALDLAKGLTAPIVVKCQIHAGGRGKGTLDVEYLHVPHEFDDPIDAGTHNFKDTLIVVGNGRGDRDGDFAANCGRRAQLAVRQHYHAPLMAHLEACSARSGGERSRS